MKVSGLRNTRNDGWQIYYYHKQCPHGVIEKDCGSYHEHGESDNSVALGTCNKH